MIIGSLTTLIRRNLSLKCVLRTFINFTISHFNNKSELVLREFEK